MSTTTVEMNLAEFRQLLFKELPLDEVKDSIDVGIFYLDVVDRENYIRPTGKKDTPEVVRASLNTLKALIELLDDRDLDKMKAKTFMEVFESSFEAHGLKSIIESVNDWMTEIVYTFYPMNKLLSPDNYTFKMTGESQYMVEILHSNLKHLESWFEEVIYFYEYLAEGISSQSDMSKSEL